MLILALLDLLLCVMCNSAALLSTVKLFSPQTAHHCFALFALFVLFLLPTLLLAFLVPPRGLVVLVDALPGDTRLLPKLGLSGCRNLATRAHESIDSTMQGYHPGYGAGPGDLLGKLGVRGVTKTKSVGRPRTENQVGVAIRPAFHPRV